MAITIRHDAAAVALPANSAQRKYGQSLVLQQQQQKYAAQQAANDRLFSALQQQQTARNNWQWGGNAQQGRPQGGAIIQQGGQQRGFGLTTTVDAQKQAMADAEQRKKDFEAARSRIDTYAKDMLANGEIADQETKNKIRNLIAGKTIVMGSGFNETAQQEYLDRYNAELAKILSEVPPPKAKPTPQEQFDQGIVVGPDGAKYRANSKGDFEPLPVQPTQPASAAEALKANPKLQSDYRNQAAGILAGPDGDKAIPGSTPEEQRAAVNALAMKLYEQDQKDFGGSQAAAQAPPVAEQVPSAPAGIPIAPPDAEQQALAQKLRDGMNGKIDDKAYDAAYREWTSKYGNSEEAEKYFNAADELIKSNGGEYNKEWQELISRGHNAKNGPINPFVEGEPQEAVQQAPLTTQPPSPSPQGPTVQPPDPGQPPAPAPPRQPLPLSSNTTSQNEWAGVAGADQPSAPVGGSQGESNQGRSELITGQPQQGGLPTVTPPDFGKLVESAQDDNEKAVISQIQGLASQHADSPDVVNALNVFVSPGSSKEDRLAAFDYLSTAGIDLNQMIAEEPGRAEKIRKVQEKNQERFGNRRDLLNGM